MEEVLLGSMSNTVSISSSSCSSGRNMEGHRMGEGLSTPGLKPLQRAEWALCPLPAHVRVSLAPAPGPVAPFEIN